MSTARDRQSSAVPHHVADLGCDLDRHQGRPCGGAAALVAGSLCYCVGSVLSRPLLDQVTPLHLTAAHGLVGAIGLSLLTLLVEPISAATFAALLTPAPLAGILFLVIGGTFIAYTIFLRLMRDWGASRAGIIHSFRRSSR